MTDGAPPDVLVAGYASIDIVLHADGAPAPGRTVLLHGPTAPKPTFGGCAPAAARGFARLGRPVALVTWLGDDEPGRRYRDLLRGEGIDVGAVRLEPGAGSPRCYLIEDPAGGVACCYHPGGSAGLHAGLETRRVLASVRCLAIAVGPAALTTALLDHCPAGAVVAWSVKADPDAFPMPLRRRLLAQSRLICLNRHELPFVLEAVERTGGGDPAGELAALVDGGDRAVVMTEGARGCLVALPGGVARIPAAPVAAADATGAGDAFFAAFVDAALDGHSPVAAARRATDFVHDLLTARTASGEGG